MLLSTIKNALDDLVVLLQQLPHKAYSLPCPLLGNASIGEHTRHIIDMFQCLQNQYDSGVVNYDCRSRNVRVQTDVDFAIAQIIAVQSNLSKENKTLILNQKISGTTLNTQSSYHRELLYNLEHCIHHQALIKVGVLQFPDIKISSSFGIAPSTIEYRNQCAQ